MGKAVVGLGPSLVDMGLQVSDDLYRTCCDLLDVQPGDWKRITSAGEFSRFVATVTGQGDGAAALSSLSQHAGATWNAGSSVLGVLGAMPPDLRAQATLMTALAQQKGALDPLSQFFREAARSAGIHHEYQLVEGYNPMGIVLSGVTNPEKILAMFPGVGGDLDHVDLRALDPALVVLDAYELQPTPLGACLDAIIQSGAFRIGLSLGNHRIIVGAVRDQIRRYIADHRIHALCGNDAEYRALFPEYEGGLATKEGFRAHPALNAIPFAVLTLGAQGMVAQWDGKEVIDTPALLLDPARIKNTSGAGDTTAGVIYAGILRGQKGIDTLRQAAWLTTFVLQTHSSYIVAEPY